MSKLLTPKQEAFAQEYILHSNATQALIAVYVTQNMSRKSMHEVASRVLKNVKVASRIEQLKAQMATKASVGLEVTQASIVKGLHKLATDPNQPGGVRVPAYMGMAKILGFIVDKKELSGTIEHLLPKRSDMSIEELRAGIATLKALEAGTVEGSYEEVKE